MRERKRERHSVRAVKLFTMKELKVARAISESSTTSDNTSDFIDIVKKYDVVYNNHNPDYKNVEVKMKVWTQIADEIGLSVGKETTSKQ